MKKTVFKGTINGKNFDSVQAYNEEMMRALAAGESVIANSETTTVDEEEAENDIDYMPGFSDDNEYYIDKYVTGDSYKDVNLYYEAKNYLENSIDIIKNDLDNFDEEELGDYEEQLNEVVELIVDDEDDNTDSLASINEEISELEQKLNDAKERRNVCINAVQIMSLFKEQYSDLLQKVIDKRDNKTNFSSCGCNCDCDCDEKCCDGGECKCKNESKLDFKDISNSITNLFKEIFG